jgi:hypothetical protein
MIKNPIRAHNLFFIKRNAAAVQKTKPIAIALLKSSLDRFE